MSILVPDQRRRRPIQTPRSGPVGGLDDHRFVYTPSVATDIRKTFRRIRAEQLRGERQ